MVTNVSSCTTSWYKITWHKYFKCDKSSGKLFTDTDRKDPRPPMPPCVMGSSAMELQLEVFGFVSTTQVEANTNKMCPRSLRTVQSFKRGYLLSQAICTRQIMVTCDCRKNLNTPNWEPNKWSVSVFTAYRFAKATKVYFSLWTCMIPC